MRLAPSRALLLAAACCAAPARAQPGSPDPVPPLAWHNDTDTCRLATDTLLHGRIGPAADAVMPDGATDRDRRAIRALMQRLAARAATMTEGMPPRLERNLPDLDLDGVPVAMAIWSFGDRRVFLVGCAIRPAGGAARIGIEARPARDQVLSGLRAALADGAADGAPDAASDAASDADGDPPAP